ncbi:MAG TPA: hypothetical protein VF699_11255 [Caulobacteraceae bacterium]
MRTTAAIAALAAAGTAHAQAPETLALIAAARADVATSAKDVWPGWDRTPFGVLLVEGEREHLVCQQAPGFGAPVRDAATGCEIMSRARVFPPGLQAAMPAFGLPATVVVGTPAATGKSRGGWRTMLLHEHFHQHQWTFPGYQARVAALDLSGGDETGMWMLNYAFPYAEPETGRLFAEASNVLAAILAKRTPPDSVDVARYLRARDRLAASVSPRDWRYAELQLWQEGVARWTEFTAAERSQDPDVAETGRALHAATGRELIAARLAEDRRLALYALGASEATLLERCGSRWRARYPVVVSMRPLLAAALEDCRR